VDTDLRSPWDRVPDATKHSLEAAVNHGVPADSIAFYARWWQLETWLRQLVYLEFRAKWGIGWKDHLVPKRFAKSPHTPASRAESDKAKNAYMASPDSSGIINYVDVGVLFMLIDDNWTLFEPCLPPKTRWAGWVDELQEIRHRSAHCRRPHTDDLARIELILRNLEKGAFRSLETFNVRFPMDALPDDDPVVQAWVNGGHPDSHLIGHGERVHDLLVRFQWSKRPWTVWKKGDPIAGCEGFFVHATYHLRSAYAPPLRLSEVLKPEDALLNHSLVYLLADPYMPEYSFSAVDDADVVNSSIAAATYDVFHVKRPGEPPKDWVSRWDAAAGSLDHRVLLNSALNLAHPDTPFPVFAAM
jgi:hypothetical protein